jgi:hypothetical protein
MTHSNRQRLFRRRNLRRRDRVLPDLLHRDLLGLHRNQARPDLLHRDDHHHGYRGARRLPVFPGRAEDCHAHPVMLHPMAGFAYW